METIDLYEAVRRMKEITDAGGTFSFKFRKYDRRRLSGGDLAFIPKAKLRPKASGEKISDADYKLFFLDVEQNRPLVCWQVLIMEFNGMKTILN